MLSSSPGSVRLCNFEQASSFLSFMGLVAAGEVIPEMYTFGAYKVVPFSCYRMKLVNMGGVCMVVLAPRPCGCTVAAFFT